MKLKKKGAGLTIASVFTLLIVLIIFFFITGGLTGSFIRNSLKDIPVWFWIVIGFVVLLSLRGKKK